MIDGRPVTSREARPSVLAADLRVALLRSARRIRSQHNSASVTEGQYSVICALFEHGELTPGELAEREKVQPPSMTRTVSALVEAGFVKREPHPTDRRQVMVSLTDKGTTEVKETKRRRTEWLAKQLAELTPQERETMAAATHLLRRLTLK